MTKTQKQAPIAAKTLGKSLKRAPIIKWQLGTCFTGTILRRGELKGKFGPQTVLTVELTEPFDYVTKDGEIKPMAAGECIRAGVKPGYAAILDLPDGTEVSVACTGKVATDKGNDAWAFDVTYRE